MLNGPFSPWPSFSDEEVEAVSKILKSNRVNYWTGHEGQNFEKEFAMWADSFYAIAVSNGTVALEMGLKVLGVGTNSSDEVIVPSRTFMATASSVVTVGARPVFADVDLNTQALSAETIKAALTPNTKAVIVVHLAGIPAEMDEIMALSVEHGFYVIEDCAQAHGAKYKGKSVGSIGHIGAWSFCQDKIMTTGGEGGMITTSSKELWSKMWSLKDHGKSYEAVFEREHPPGFRWLHESFGSNYRMTEMQAAIGRIQLKKMNEWSEARRKNAAMIDEVALEFPKLFRLSHVPDDCVYAAYKHYLFIRPEALKEDWSRDRFITEVNNLGVPCMQGSCSEVYLEKAFDEDGLRPTTPLQNAKILGETSLMFLVHPTLSLDEMKLTVDAIRTVGIRCQ